MGYRLEDQDEPTLEALRVLGATYRSIRDARGLTQRQLSARSGLSQSTISRFENGRAPWLAAVWIARLLAALDVEPGLDGFGTTAVKSPVPGWVVMMKGFEGNRRYRDRQVIAAQARAAPAGARGEGRARAGGGAPPPPRCQLGPEERRGVWGGAWISGGGRG